MNQHLKTIFIALCTLFAFGLARAQGDNAVSSSEDKLKQLFDDALDGFTNGYTTPMRIIGSKANSSVDIGIDTIRYTREGADGAKGEVTFDAHVDLQIPFAIEDGKESTKINFKGRNLNLVGGGESKLSLETELPPITIFENKISLQLGQESYVTFDCDGIKVIGLKGAFIFDKEFIKPAAGCSHTEVRAEFDIKVADWDDLMFKANFTCPFEISGGGGYVFEVKDLVVDFSTQTNVPGFTFPAGYETGFEDDNIWTGFALKEIKITPPSEIDELDNGGKRDFSYKISDMLIDRFGLTGSFLATRAPNQGGKNSGLNLSIDTIGITITQNHITGGILGGSANVPFLKDKDDKTLELGISGQVQYDRQKKKLLYRLSGTGLNAQKYGVPFTKQADITLAQGCSFTIGNMNTQNKFGATLVLNGSLNINADLNLKGVRFEELKLSTLTPHFDWEYFGLVGSAGPSFAGFSLNLTKLELTKNGENEATLGVAAKIALMGDDMSIGAEAGFKIKATYEQDNNKWEFRGPIAIDKICLNMDFSAFRFDGCLVWFDKDDNPMYGDGFKGDIKLEIKSLGFKVGSIVYFGKTKYNRENPNKPFDDAFKYWFVKMTADVSGMNIMLFPPAVMLKSITGGVYQRMSNSLCVSAKNMPKDVNKDVNKINLKSITDDPEYIPDKETSFGFMAGVGAYFGQENLVAIEVLLEMAFNSHNGLNYVSLKGLGSFLSSEIGKGMVKAGVFAYYNVEDKIFSLQAAVEIDFVKVITGKGTIDIYSSPKKWHCYVGTNTHPNNLNFAGIVKVKSYFMAGAIPSQLPPLNTKMLALFGAKSFSDAGQKGKDALDGKGFAFGISMGADCGFGQNKGFVFAYIDIDAGIDALINFSRLECGTGKNKKEGKWRGKGQLYCYMDGAAGVRIRKKKHKIISLTGAAMLQAEIPAPYYFEGKIAFKYKVLCVKGSVNKGFSKGEKCP